MGAVGKLFSGMFAKPKLPKVASMPDPGSPSAKAAAAQKVREKRKFGRAGDIYSGDQAYTASNLGGTRSA
jgi:hypothetical protein